MSAIEENNPIAHFQKWFYEVDKAHPEEEANTMLLSTVGLDGYPKSRIVLLKRFTWEGFIFFTNYDSDKGQSIKNNNNVSISFNWSTSLREVLISGTAEKIADNLSEGYFESRPDGSKLSAWASHQSEVISSRKILEDRLQAYEKAFKHKSIPKPRYWGGYLVKPQKIEFIEHPIKKEIHCITSYELQEDYNWSKNVSYQVVN